MPCMVERCVSRFTVVSNATISYLPDCIARSRAWAESLPPLQLKTAFIQFHVTCPALWKNPQTRVRYSGNLPSVPHFRSMPKSSAVVLPMSNPQASSDGRTSSGCRQGFPSGRVQVPSGQWRHVPT